MYAMVLFWHFFCFQSLSVFLCLTDYKLCSTILGRFDPSWPPNSDQGPLWPVTSDSWPCCLLLCTELELERWYS